ncbi:MAG TPA: PAS domain S-box protein, partial [Candidatus Polarisedimenticolia bacterium]|nr:PAS domain S-box protein [Candidatus Polarisedimenticolia bacterium]
ILVGLVVLLALAVAALGIVVSRMRAVLPARPAAPAGLERPGAASPAATPAHHEESLRILLDQLPAVSWTVDRDLRFTSSSGAGLAALGLRQGEVVGRTLFEYFQTSDRSFAPIAAHLRSLDGATVGYRFEWGGRTFQTQVEPFRAADQSVVGAIGVAHDVTDMQRAYDALAKTMERYHDLVDNLEGVVWEADPADLRITFVSQQAVALFGHPMHRWLGEPGFWPSLIHKDDRDRVIETVRGAAADSKPRHAEYRARAADGRWLTILQSVRRIGGDRTPPALRGLMVDVTRDRTTRTAKRPGGRGRILVLDDEEMIRTLLRDLLGVLGYEVAAVADGEAAIAAYEEARAAGRRFDLVIFDLTIRGGLGGREAFDRMRAQDPAIRGVVSSGSANDPVMTRGAEHGFEGVLPKPYTIDDLAALLGRLLGGSI